MAFPCLYRCGGKKKTYLSTIQSHNTSKVEITYSTRTLYIFKIVQKIDLITKVPKMVHSVPRSEPWSSVKSLVDLTPVSCTVSSFLGSGKIVGLDLGVFLRLDLKLPPFNTFCQIIKMDHKNKISICF